MADRMDARNPDLLNRSFVVTWSRRYTISELERELLNEVGPAVAERGYFERRELAKVGEWRSPRIRPRLAQNADDDVEDITHMALASHERLQHRILGLLHGVGDPVASAILTVWGLHDRIVARSSGLARTDDER